MAAPDRLGAWLSEKACCDGSSSESIHAQAAENKSRGLWSSGLLSLGTELSNKAFIRCVLKGRRCVICFAQQENMASALTTKA